LLSFFFEQALFVKLILILLLPFDRYACSLLRQDMKQIVVTLDSSDILSLEKQEDKEALKKVNSISCFGIQFSLISFDLWYNDCL